MQNVPVQRHRFIIEGFECLIQPTEQLCCEFMNALTSELKMNLWQGPFSGVVQAEQGKEPGYSAVVMWLESGAQLHHWSNYRFITLDIFSCRPFSILGAESLFRTYFQPEEVRNCTPVLRHQKG